MAKTRVFVAVTVTAETRHAAIHLADELRDSAAGFRWVAEDNLHFTLQFLGDLTDQEIADVCSSIGRAARAAEPFTLEARGAGAFPDLDRPRTLWIGAGEGADRLVALQQEVEAALDSLGFRAEHRRYVPHLTFGRAGRTAAASTTLSAALADFADFEAGVSLIDAITIFASELYRDGPQYHVLATCPLGG